MSSQQNTGPRPLGWSKTTAVCYSVTLPALTLILVGFLAVFNDKGQGWAVTHLTKAKLPIISSCFYLICPLSLTLSPLPLSLCMCLFLCILVSCIFRMYNSFSFFFFSLINFWNKSGRCQRVLIKRQICPQITDGNVGSWKHSIVIRRKYKQTVTHFVNYFYLSIWAWGNSWMQS